MKRIILSALCAVPAFCMGQTLLYNDGAMVKVQAGATLYVEGGIQNTASGTIDNDGTIEVKGDFINNGTWDPNQPNTLIFSGNVDSDVTSGTAVFQTVVIQKDNNFDVNILDHMTINDNLDFNAAGTSKINTGNNRLKIGNNGTVTGYDADEYVVTDGTGEMEKKVNADGTFFFPVGDATNYSPIECTYAGTGYSAGKIRTHVNNVVHPNNPGDATEFINRYWDVNAIGITDYTNDLTGTYVPGDVVLGAGGTAGQIKGAVYDGADWTYAGADAGANQVMGSTDVATAEFTGANFFGEIDIKAFLQGPYSTSTNLMTTTLNTNGLIPLNSPYPDAPATVASIPANVTDWVKVELRDPAVPAVAVGKAAAFIKNDGSVVGLDGTSLPRIKNGFPTSVVALYHRNHLPIRTPNAGLDVLNPTLHDFTADLANAHDGPPSNDAMISLDDPPVWAMYMGNATGDKFINVIDLIQVKLNSNPSQFNVYSVYDVTMDKNVNVVDLIFTKQQSNPSKTASIDN